MKTALFELGVNPLSCDYVLHPEGVSLAFHALTPFNSLLAALAGFLVGPVAACNVVFLLAFWLAGYGAFLLAHRLTGRIGPSLLAGYIYAFSPYQFFHIRQLEHMSIQWLPFLVLFILRLIETGRRRDAFFAAVFFAINFHTNVYFGLFSVPLLVLFLAADLIERRTDRDRLFAALRHWLLFAAVGGLLIAPYLAAMLSFASLPGRFRVPLAVNVHQSLDLLSFVTPSFMNPLLSGWFPTMGLYQRFTGWEPVGYLGFSVIALAIAGLLRGEARHRRLLALAALLFLVLSLGPLLHVAGVTRFFGRVILLPQAIMQVLPIVSAARVPARYLAVAMLPLAMLAAIGLARLAASPAGGRRRLLPALLVALVVIEYWNGPLETSRADAPPPYIAIIRADPADVAVLDLPLRVSEDPAEWWRAIDPDTRGWYQTLHHKRAVYGPISHTALRRSHYEALLGSPVLGPLVSASDSPPLPPRTAAMDELRRLRLRYVVQHRYLYDRLPPAALERDRRILAAWGFAEIHRDEEATLFTLE
jgi:hypothetical protein